MNFIKSRNRSSLTDETRSSCISLKGMKYIPDVKFMSAAEISLITHIKSSHRAFCRTDT